IEGGSMSVAVGWIVMAVAVALAAALFLVRDSRRRSSGLAAPPVSVTWLKIACMAIAGVAAVLIRNTNPGVAIAVRGVLWVVLLVLVVLVAGGFLRGRPRFGRSVFSIGGRAEAARRAG